MRRVLRLYFGRGRDGERPPLATVLFWFGCLLPIVSRFVDRDPLSMPVWSVLVPLAAVFALWPLLDWKPAKARWHVIALFAVCALAYSFAEGSGQSLYLILVVLAELVITLGTWSGVAASILLTPTMFVTVKWLYRRTWPDAAAQAIGGLLLCLATVAVAHVISIEQRRRLEAAGLLDEVRTAHTALQEAHRQLADAHAQLRARADQARELAVAEERARLSREVHDAVGHHLTVVKLGLTNAVRLHERAGDDAAWEEVAEARNSATTALDEVRRGVRVMGPGPLAQATLGTALADLVDSFGATGLATSFRVDGSVRPLGPAVDATLYRVTEEALTNVRRHATEASRADVWLVYGAADVTLTVTDDGHGSNPVVPGFGLAGARSRLAEVGGDLQVSRRSTDGVELRATISAAAQSAEGLPPVPLRISASGGAGD